MWVLRRPRRQRRRADARLPDPPRRAAPRRRDRRRRRPPTGGIDAIEEAVERVAGAEGRDRLVPAQPDDRRRDGRRACSGSSTSRASTSSCSCTTSRTPTSPSTATSRRPCSRPTAPLDCAVELYSLTKSFSMAGWRVGFVARPRRRRRRAREAEVLPRLRHVPADPDRRRSSRCARRADYPAEVCEIYRSRRDALCAGLARAGWHVEPPRGTMFVWAPIPEQLPRARLARVRAPARARGRRRGQPRHRLRRRAATGTCASRSSRTSSGSARRRARSSGCCEQLSSPGRRSLRRRSRRVAAYFANTPRV